MDDNADLLDLETFWHTQTVKKVSKISVYGVVQKWRHARDGISKKLQKKLGMLL